MYRREACIGRVLGMCAVKGQDEAIQALQSLVADQMMNFADTATKLARGGWVALFEVEVQADGLFLIINTI